MSGQKRRVALTSVENPSSSQLGNEPLPSQAAWAAMIQNLENKYNKPKKRKTTTKKRSAKAPTKKKKRSTKHLQRQRKVQPKHLQRQRQRFA